VIYRTTDAQSGSVNALHSTRRVPGADAIAVPRIGEHVMLEWRRWTVVDVTHDPSSGGVTVDLAPAP
jgi:hypothetical protein